MKIQILKVSFIYLLLCSCAMQNKPSPEIIIEKSVSLKEHTVLAVLWQQNAAEYRALCHQAFNIAKVRLDEIVINAQANKPLAIITDIDETILDNSPYQTELITQDDHYNKESWIKWGKRETATLVPGAKAFIDHAAQLGVEVFYLSNRYEEQLEETINNLRKFDLVNANKNHVILKTTTSGKEQRRQKISETHEVVLLLGDNLSDFDDVYDNQNTENRNQLVENMKSSFGRNFIVFPNPMYGDWETKGIYDDNQLTDPEKEKVRFSKLKH